MDTQRCRTRTYLTQQEEKELVKLIMNENEKSTQANNKEKRQQAPRELCDLIF